MEGFWHASCNIILPVDLSGKINVYTSLHKKLGLIQKGIKWIQRFMAIWGENFHFEIKIQNSWNVSIVHDLHSAILFCFNLTSGPKHARTRGQPDWFMRVDPCNHTWCNSVFNLWSSFPWNLWPCMSPCSSFHFHNHISFAFLNYEFIFLWLFNILVVGESLAIQIDGYDLVCDVQVLSPLPWLPHQSSGWRLIRGPG